MAKTQKNTEQKQKKSTQQSKRLTAQLSQLTEEQLKAVLTEAVQTAEEELKAEEAQQKQTAEEQKQTETAEEQTAEQTAEQRIERTVTDRDFAELKAVAQSFKIRDNGFRLLIESQKQLEDADGEGTDNSVEVGQYGFGSNGKGELISVWCRRKATERKALLLTEWLDGKKKATEKHSFPCDFGLRFSQPDFEMFNSVTDCKAIIDSLSTEHAEVKHNEPRFSFKTLSAVTQTLATLYNAYESAQKQTAEQTDNTAEAQQTEEAHTA